jgi:hypothetical protein
LKLGGYNLNFAAKNRPKNSKLCNRLIIQIVWLHIPLDSGRRFRAKPATDSD